MKLAYVSPTGALGGAEMCLVDLLASARVRRPDWRPHVLLGSEGPLEDELKRLDVPVEILPLPSNVARFGDAALSGRSRTRKLTGLALGGLSASAGTAVYRSRLARRLSALGPDLIHTNGMKAHVLGAWSAPRKTPLVWWMHDYSATRPAMSRLLRLSRRPLLTAVAVSRSVAEDAAKVLGPSVEVRTVYNRVDLERFRPNADDGADLDLWGRAEPAPPGTLRVGLVATFAAWKGHGAFLKAASLISRDLPARFYIVGGPIYKTGGSQVCYDDLKRTAADLGVSDRLVMTGHAPRPERAIAALDVVVHASTSPEPFGRVVVEGMACGKPVVAMRAGGTAELFEDGETALGCPPNDPGALAAAVDRLLRNPDLRESLGREGRRAAVERFDRADLAEEWAAVYDAALAERKG